MRAILLALIALIWCVGLAGTATTRGNGGGGSGGGGDKNAGQMLESEVLEAADLAAAAAERETSQQLVCTRRCTQRAASCAARWPTQPGPLDLVAGAARAARLRARRKDILGW